MSNATSSAFPAQERDASGSPCMGMEFGLTKREYFAGLAMQGLAAKGDSNTLDHSSTAGYVAIQALRLADALLAELAKGK